MGEPSGIGPEVAVAAFQHFGGRIGRHPLKLVGDAGIFASHKEALIPTSTPVTAVPGQPTAANIVLLASPRTTFTLSEGVGDTVVTWDPRVVIAVPITAVAGTYTGTLTFSVA